MGNRKAGALAEATLKGGINYTVPCMHHYPPACES